MSGKLLWTGLTIMLAVPEFERSLPWKIVGGIIMIIGVVAMWIDR